MEQRIAMKRKMEREVAPSVGKTIRIIGAIVISLQICMMMPVSRVYDFMNSFGSSVTSSSISKMADDIVSGSGSTGERFSGEKIRTYNPNLNVRGMFSNPLGVNPFKKFFSGNPLNAPTCHQWAVVTTIFEPNESIIGTANLKNWCIVIVGDKKTPDEAYKELQKKDNVLYMSATLQSEMLKDRASSFMQMLPWNSFARKNIGYAVAIAHGAKVIYDFDDDNILLTFEDNTTTPLPFFYRDDVGFDALVHLRYIPEEYLETVVQKRAFNPFPFMGPDHIHSWPRGFPLESLSDNFETWDLIKEFRNSFAKTGSMKFSSIGVIQSLCNTDPDNDAVFRLSRLHSTQFEFDRSLTAMPLLIPSSAYTPYNAQATTHLYSAFWGMYLPFTVKGRVTDIWRSFIVQRIFRYLGLNVLYIPPIVTHERSAHDYLADFDAESDVYLRTSTLQAFLDDWSPKTAETLPEMVFELWVGLYERNYIQYADVEAVKEWLNVLIAIGYKFPVVDKIEKRTWPLEQPNLVQQPYFAYPYFNVNKDGMTAKDFFSRKSTTEEAWYDAWLATLNWNDRPDSAVIKLVMMTMNEWPLLESWVLYHGSIFGFENLYIIDSSTDPRSLSFLRYVRNSLGANVIFADIDLNHLAPAMTEVAHNIAASSDFIIKMDTDEFLSVYNSSTGTLVQSVSDYLSGYAKNKHHPLRLLTSNSRIGYRSNTLPSRDICEKDEKAPIEEFPTMEFQLAKNYKMVHLSSVVFRDVINLGGHASVKHDNSTDLAVIHSHRRCPEIEMANNKKAVLRHGYIRDTDTPDQAVKSLEKRLNCSKEELCSDWRNSCGIFGMPPSFHKIVGYVRQVTCPEIFQKDFYNASKGTEVKNEIFRTSMKIAVEKYGLKNSPP